MSVRYLVCLLLLWVMQAVAWIITPLLPLFRVDRFGPINNGTGKAVAPRLPLWLAWFDTPDNSLLGDANWAASHTPATYGSMVGWLYRNSLYGFRWTVLAARTDLAHMTTAGNPQVNRNNGILGLFRARQPKGVWQWKLVKPLIGKRGVMLNFGWQLNSAVISGQNCIAMFQFSPRWVSIKT